MIFEKGVCYKLDSWDKIGTKLGQIWDKIGTDFLIYVRIPYYTMRARNACMRESNYEITTK